MGALRQAFEDSLAANIIQAIRCELSNSVVFIDTEKFFVSGFKGKRSVKADLHIRCGNLEAAKKAAEEFIHKQAQQHKEKLAHADQQVNIFTEGDLLVSRWGSEQTNIDFYQVIKATAKNIRFRKLKTEISFTDVLNGKCIPLPNQFVESSKELMRRVTDDYVFIESYAIARKFKEAATLSTGTKVYQSQRWSATA